MNPFLQKEEYQPFEHKVEFVKDLRQRNDSSKSQREDANPNSFEFSPNSTKLNQTPKQNKHSFFNEGEHSSDKKSANDDS